MSKVTAERLRHILSYDPISGLWIWINPPKHNSQLKGQIAGTFHDEGYRIIRIDSIAYYSHRLAFLYMTGKWPDEEVDHIDRDQTNDAWDNLREATSSLNKWNQMRHLNSPYNPLTMVV